MNNIERFFNDAAKVIIPSAVGIGVTYISYKTQCYAYNTVNYAATYAVYSATAYSCYKTHVMINDYTVLMQNIPMLNTAKENIQNLATTFAEKIFNNTQIESLYHYLNQNQVINLVVENMPINKEEAVTIAITAFITYAVLSSAKNIMMIGVSTFTPVVAIAVGGVATYYTHEYIQQYLEHEDLHNSIEPILIG